MDSLQNYEILRSVVDLDGFTAAAKALGLTTAKVSRAVAEVEAELGVRLLERTTRTVSVTEAGRSFLARVGPALEQILDARKGLAGAASKPEFNALRLSCCRAAGLGLVAPAVARFMVEHPETAVALDLHDRSVSADNEGYDLVMGISTGFEPETPGSRLLATVDLAIVAEPGYIAMHKRPQEPTELLQHRLLSWSGMPQWDMRGGVSISPRTAFYSNDLNVIRICCIAASGIALLPHFMIREELAHRTLVQLLDGFEPKPLKLMAGWGSRRSPCLAAQTFIAHLETWLRRSPA